MPKRKRNEPADARGNEPRLQLYHAKAETTIGNVYITTDNLLQLYHAKAETGWQAAPTYEEVTLQLYHAKAETAHECIFNMRHFIVATLPCQSGNFIFANGRNIGNPSCNFTMPKRKLLYLCRFLTQGDSCNFTMPKRKPLRSPLPKDLHTRVATLPCQSGNGFSGAADDFAD